MAMPRIFLPNLCQTPKLDKFLVNKLLLWEFSAGKDEKNGFTVYLPCLECLECQECKSASVHFAGLSQISLYEDLSVSHLTEW